MSATDVPLRLMRRDAVATLTIDRPDRRNAISLAMYQAFLELLAQVAADREIKILVLRGAGRDAFAAGADISEFQAVRGDADSARRYNVAVLNAEGALARLEKPTIAMVHGHCVGGGAGLALACDLRFADDQARFAVPPAKLGLVYGFDATRRLVALVGPARAKLLLISGDPVDAARAESIGLVDMVVRPEDLETRTYEFAEGVCRRAQFSVRAAKEMVGRIAAGQAEEDEAMRDLRTASFDTEDYAEGVRAFLEKRSPAFTWR